MSNVNLPQKAGFVPTVGEWDALVRIAENLAAQVVQAQASAVETARIVGAERDAARAEVARLTAALAEEGNGAQMADELCEVSEGAYPIDPAVLAIRDALRQPAPAPAQTANRCTCDLSDTPDAPADWHFETCPEYKPAPAPAKE